MLPSRQARLRSACAAAIEAASKGEDWMAAMPVWCKSHGLPDIVAMARRKNFALHEALDLAVALGSMVQNAEQKRAAAEAAKSTKRGRPYNTGTEDKRAKVRRFVKLASYMPESLTSQTLSKLKPEQALVAVADGADEGAAPDIQPENARRRTRRSRKKRTQLRAKYNRKRDDELSILQKREIASWQVCVRI